MKAKLQAMEDFRTTEELMETLTMLKDSYPLAMLHDMFAGMENRCD